MDWALVAAIIGFFTVCMLFLVSRVIIQALHDGLDDLDAKIVAALQQLLKSGMGDFEPPNPIQAALAQFIANKVDSKSQIVEAVVSDKKS
jgi:hypothetical protein